MTIGISKKRLSEWKRISVQKGLDGIKSMELLNLIIKECKELDPWLPIDENTPLDGRDLLLHDGIDTVIGFWEIDSWYTESGHVHPTHYKLLSK